VTLEEFPRYVTPEKAAPSLGRAANTIWQKLPIVSSHIPRKPPKIEHPPNQL
jgi:hypothetical protein